MSSAPAPAPQSAILLVGHPNVGKSVLFHRLTGAYVNVSNYPGTTVEITRASARFDSSAMLLDTPGVLALPSRSDDERATMQALLDEASADPRLSSEDLDALRRDDRLVAFIERSVEPLLRRWFRAEVRGVERVPEGAALFVGNHSGGFVTPDTWIFCSALYRARGPASLPYGLAHEVPLKIPLIGDLISRLGAVRACQENAERLLAGRSGIEVCGLLRRTYAPSPGVVMVSARGAELDVVLGLEVGAEMRRVERLAAGTHRQFFSGPAAALGPDVRAQPVEDRRQVGRHEGGPGAACSRRGRLGGRGHQCHAVRRHAGHVALAQAVQPGQGAALLGAAR